MTVGRKKITEEEYALACRTRQDCEKIIHQYLAEKTELAQSRIDSGEPFTDEELIYSAHTLCPCGHGLAYPRMCPPNHYWDCSAILKGIADKNVKHTDRLPFAFYEVKSESDHRGTTRGVFRPKNTAQPATGVAP